MSFWQREKSSRRVAPLKRPRLRSGRLGCESLEDRRLLTLLGVVPLTPAFTYDSNGHIAYTASAQTFDLTATPLTFKNISGPPNGVVTPRSLAVHVLVDNSGNLIGGTSGDDLEIDGTVSPDGVPAHTVSGVLLTGEVIRFGYAESGATDQYDFRFVPTGGLLLSYFTGNDIAMTVSSENSTFNNDFSQDFTGGAKGNIGNITSLPGHIIVDKVTNPAGDPTSFNFNTTGAAYTGFSLTDTATPNDQTLVPGTYTVSELVPSGWDLTNLTVVDPTNNSSTSGPTATLVLGSGETIYVTYTDTKRATIQVIKNTVGGNGTFDFTGTGGSNLPANFSITTSSGTGSTTVYSVTPGNYSVLENIPAGWSLKNVTISETGGSNNSMTSGATATLTAEAGETIVITYCDTKNSCDTKPGCDNNKPCDPKPPQSCDPKPPQSCDPKPAPVCDTKPPAYNGNQTGCVAFWNCSSGQALIKTLNGGSSSKTLGNWLATNYSNIYGAGAGAANNLSGKTNAQVASYFQSLASSSSKKLEAETMALALSVFVTNSSLAGTVASAWGFSVSAAGLGGSTCNVGSNGSSCGVTNYTSVTVCDLLSRANARASNGRLCDANGDGSLSSSENTQRSQALALIAAINNT